MSASLQDEDARHDVATNDSQKTELVDPEHEQVASQPQHDPPSEWEVLRAQVRSKSGDSDSWLKLVDVAVESGDYDRVNETYEALLEAYPNTVRVSLVLLAS